MCSRNGMDGKTDRSERSGNKVKQKTTDEQTDKRLDRPREKPQEEN